jgi:protein phosphatase
MNYPIVLLPMFTWPQAQERPTFLLATIIVVLLLLGIAVLGFLWQVLRRRRQLSPGKVTWPDGGTGIEPPAGNHARLEASQVEAAPAAAGLETTAGVPALADQSEDKTKTQPSPAYKKEQLETKPTHLTGEPITVPLSGQSPARAKWQIAGLTDTGLKRELNEDNLLMLEAEMADSSPYGLFLVADGMGGHQGGDIASQLTVDTIRQQFNDYPLSYEIPFNDWLKNTVIAANQAVLKYEREPSRDRKMGSTLVMALVTEGQAHIVNVGDSRAYHITDDGIEQISVDHSLVERLVQLGQLTREEARTHRQRNVIYNTIGDKPDPEIGLYHILLHPGDRLLLCSDGLSGMMPDADILAISRQQASPVAACKALVEAAKLAGGDDNITVILVQVGAP